MSMELRLNRLGIDPDLPEEEIMRRVELQWAAAKLEMEAATREWEERHQPPPSTPPG
jgi:hypothetical protein